MNRLASEPSPYLRQHAANPVDWYPWGPEALARASELDLPIFLSIGYASCHWCHVMAHESFEDTDIAAYLNEHFVSVKVDREERPDIDSIYMDAVQAMAGRGGWPMTVFLTPDTRPFFGGTYFPPEDRHGLPGFGRLLRAVHEAWRDRREELERQAGALAEAIEAAGSPGRTGPRQGARSPYSGTSPGGHELLHRAVGELSRRFDEVDAGFSPAPKFPNPQLVEICLIHHRLSGGKRALDMASRTLAAMAAGGIYDHLGGGFARYSTDATWSVPHFEKMLYDQAGLLRCYLHAWQSTGERRWLQVVEETAAYVLQDLALDGGGLASSEDADSEGEEGRFYLWERSELEQLLPPDLARAAIEWYGLGGPPNFEGSRYVLRRPPGAPIERPEAVEQARVHLARARAQRTRPARDDKVVTEWNAMFCSALAEAAWATANPTWESRAIAIADMLLRDLRRPTDGRWLRSWCDGVPGPLACAADYAWLVDAFTRLAELTGKAHFAEEARSAARELLRLFYEPGSVLHMTGNDAEALFARPADAHDGATPSATSVAACALVRLGALSCDQRMTDAAEELIHAALALTPGNPLPVAGVLPAAVLADDLVEVVVAGRRPDLLDALRPRFEPAAVMAWGDPAAWPLFDGREEGYAYVCRHMTCRAPSATVEELLGALSEESAAAARSHARNTERPALHPPTGGGDSAIIDPWP